MTPVATWYESGQQSRSPQLRARLAAGIFSVPPAVLVGLVLLLAAGWIAGLVGLLLVAFAGFAWVAWAADRRVSAWLQHGPISTRAADPVDEARLHNLVESLSVTAGVRAPQLVVIDSPGLNAMAAGSRAGRYLIGVTSGLLSALSRVEMEAVVAEAMWLLRHGETVPLTALAATFGLGRNLAVRSDRDSAADLGAVALTRYPPALASALTKMEAAGSGVAGVPAYLTDLWLVDPRPEGDRSARVALGRRIGALEEL